MKKWVENINWIPVCLVNFLIVAFLGVLMRYKIAYELPYFNQSHLQHAHSHLAFSAWISLLLMFLMVRSLKQKNIPLNYKLYYTLAAYFVCAFTSFIFFIIEGYAFYSILFSSLLMLINFIYCWHFIKIIKINIEHESSKWYLAALLFNILSALGTFYLIYLNVTKNFDQHSYLSSVYWYLHFQYNGWFFFGLIGLFVDFLSSQSVDCSKLRNVFWAFALSCLPAFGLSILWLKIPMPIYILIILAAASQCFAFFYLIHFAKRLSLSALKIPSFYKLFIIAVLIALAIKLLLQLGSTIPEVNVFAFGFRTIVIAYLHLVLLVFCSGFLIVYLFINNLIIANFWSKTGLLFFMLSIICNEFVLAIQGIASINYTPVPYANEILLFISVIIFISILMINLATLISKYKSV